jgi:hypothetical protein
MELLFEIEGAPARFRRDPWTGKAELRVGNDVIPLQSPADLSTHFNVSTRRVWRQRIGDHDVEIVTVRPRILGGLRSKSFTISIDSTVVAEDSGL